MRYIHLKDLCMHCACFNQFLRTAGNPCFVKMLEPERSWLAQMLPQHAVPPHVDLQPASVLVNAAYVSEIKIHGRAGQTLSTSSHRHVCADAAAKSKKACTLRKEHKIPLPATLNQEYDAQTLYCIR
jgi:hypothetical protein